MQTAAERLYGAITDPGLKSQLQDNALQAFREEAKGYTRKNPYAQQQAAAHYLESQGIGTMPYACRLHTHGADKALENQMLELTSYRLNRLHPGPYTFLQLKPGKLGHFRVPYQTKDGQWRERGRAITDKDQFINWAKEVRDFSRFDDGRYTPISGLCDQTVLHSTAFMSDTLHFLQPADLIWLFLCNPALQDLLATVVLPIEAKEQMRALHPEIYKLEYFKTQNRVDSFAYYPGGHAGSGYVHSIDTLQWLEIGKISCGELVLTIDKVETVAAHHLLHVTRRRADTPSRFLFEISEYARVPKLFHPDGYNARQAYPKKMLSQLDFYAKSIKVVSLRDLAAKMRSIIPTAELAQFNTRDIICLENFLLYRAGLNALCDAPTLLDKGFLEGMLTKFKACFRPTIELLFGKSEYSQLLTLSELEDISFTTIPKTIEYSTGAFSFANIKLPPLPGAGEFPPRAPRLWGFDIDNSDVSSNSSRSSISSCTPNKEKKMPNPASSTHSSTTASSESPDLDNDDDSNSPPTFGPDLGHEYEDPLEDLPEDELELRKELWQGDMPDRATIMQALRLRYETHEVKILRSCGFDDLNVQRGPLPSRIASKNNIEQLTVEDKLKLWDIPCIITNSKVKQPCAWPEETPPLLHKALEDLNRLPRLYAVDAQRGSSYSSDCKHRHIGMLMKKQKDEFLQSLDARTEATKFKVPICVIHGAGGSGKSRAIQSVLRADTKAQRKYLVIVPTQELRRDWVDKLPGLKRNVSTLERAMLEGGKPIVVFDDYGKLPAGYIDCWLATHTNTVLAILTADSRQSVYHCENPQARIAGLVDNVTAFEDYCAYYINCTHRNPRNIANALFVHSSRQDDGNISDGPSVRRGQTVLVPSRACRDVFNEMGHDAYTYAGCQGLSRNGINVVLDHSAPHCSDEVLYTALSRTTGDIHFVNSWGEGDAAEQKRNCTPYINSIISHRREVEIDLMLEEPVEEKYTAECRIKTHCPIVNNEALVEELTAELPDKYDRELWDDKRKEHSNVFQSESPLVQLMAHQQAKDETLFQATIDSRLNIATVAENEADLQAGKKLGGLLFEAYYERMNLTGVTQPFDGDLWAECEAEVERTYLSKPEAALTNGQDRQSPDMDENQIALFLKSQWVKKEEKLGKPAKAGQTIASFRQDVVMRFGVAARYMRRQREKTQPSNLFIMCERTPEQMSKFIKDHWNFERDNYESDYTQYDQSQGGEFLDFELRKMRYYELPDSCIQAYTWIKTHAKVFCGQLSIMRLSGEGPTFDANTECNIAYDSLRFKIPAEVTAMYAGDDLARDKVCEERPCWTRLGPMFKLTAKPVVTKKPQFCGWRITKYGVVKSPLKLWAGLMLAQERQQMELVARSYGLDYKYAFDLGDKIMDVFDEKDLEYHTAATRLLVRHGFGISTGEHTPAYHVRSDHLLGVLKSNPRKVLKDPLSDEDAQILRVMDEETAGNLTGPRK